MVEGFAGSLARLAGLHRLLRKLHLGGVKGVIVAEIEALISLFQRLDFLGRQGGDEIVKIIQVFVAHGSLHCGRDCRLRHRGGLAGFARGRWLGLGD